MRARLARLFLIVALLAGWQAALLHPLQHVNGQGGLVHASGGQSGKTDSDSSRLCDALAALTACAPVAPPAFKLAVADQRVERVAEFEPRAAEAPPFLAQGPPAPL
jgi:hypothetical protein